MPDTPLTPGLPGEGGDPGGSLWAASSLPVGAAVQPALLQRDPAYRATLVREFNAITPENAMKWGRGHPFEREWSFDPADQLVTFAEAHGMCVHGQR